MDRRQFNRSLLTGAAAAFAVANAPLTKPLFAAPAAQETEKGFSISLAQWSYHRALKAGGMDNLDFAKETKALGINAVEYVNQFFKDKADDMDYLGEMKSRAEGEGVESLLIMIDGEGALGAATEAERKKTVENHKKWVEAAKFLGGHSIRVNAQSSGSYDEQIERAADGLRMLSEFAKDFAINVIVENHGGLSSNGEWLAATLARVDMDNCGSLPDFGNFIINRQTGESFDKYEGVQLLMPFAKAVSAKSYDFDENGNEVGIDYERMMEIVLAHGYHGYVGIEYEGSKLGEKEGILATKTLLERVHEKLVG